jgi:Cu/Ag efflux pump CusA
MRVTLVALNSINNKQKKIDEELEKEIEKIKRKFDLIAEPLLKRTAELITGVSIPNEKEL